PSAPRGRADLTGRRTGLYRQWLVPAPAHRPRFAQGSLRRRGLLPRPGHGRPDQPVVRCAPGQQLMRESVLPEGVMDFLASRRGWFWILSAAGALLLLFVLVTWLRFGLVRVHYTTGDHVGNGRIGARAYDIESNTATDEDAFTTIFGLALVPRSTRYVDR